MVIVTHAAGAVTPVTARYGPRVQPVDREELAPLVEERFGNHPWARLCTTPAAAWSAGWVTDDAIVWRSGHPWNPVPDLHGLGEPAAVAAAVARLARPSEHVIVPAGTPLVAAAGFGPPHLWDIRMAYRPGPVLPGEERVRWLASDDGVGALLDLANPHAAIGPGDRRGGRWCGVRDDDGRLVAVAVETLLAAPIAHLSSLGVHPDHRRQGLAQAVTSFFVREGFATGAPEIMLAVDLDNPRAGALYDRLGFDTWPMAGHTR